MVWTALALLIPTAFILYYINSIIAQVQQILVPSYMPIIFILMFIFGIILLIKVLR